MAYINQIVVENTTYDIGAKNLVDGFTQSTSGVNALDAHAGKTLNDTLTTTKSRADGLFERYGSWDIYTGTIDQMLNNGIYPLNGSSAQGTFPTSGAKYGILFSMHRGTSQTIQIIVTGSNMWIREAGSSIGAWTTVK